MEKKKNSELIVKCPKCQESFAYYSSECRPFCSERCSNVDLGNWFNESFSIPVDGPLEPEEVAELEKVLEEKYGNSEF